MCWLWLSLAIALDVAATVCQKLSNGFSRLIPTVLMAVFYGVSLVPMGLALRKLEVATVYAIWSAAGTALVTMIGMLAFKEAATPLKCGAIVLIVAGVVCLNLSGRQSESQSAQSAEARKAAPILPFDQVRSGASGAPRLAAAETPVQQAVAVNLIRIAGRK